VRGERFELDSNEALAAFAGGAAEGITNVLGASVAKGMTGPLIDRMANLGPRAAKLAAGRSFKTIAAAVEKGLEGGVGGAFSPAVEAAVKDETWQGGIGGVLIVGEQAAGGFVTGVAMTGVTHGIEVTTGVVKKALTRLEETDVTPPPPAPETGPAPKQPTATPDVEVNADPAVDVDVPAATAHVPAKPPIAAVPPLEANASLFRRRAYDWVVGDPDLLAKVGASGTSLDALEELFARSGGYGVGVTPVPGQSVPLLHRAAPSEMKTLLDYVRRPDVTRVEAIPSSSAGRTPDFVVHRHESFIAPDGTTQTRTRLERVEITTVTGTAPGYHPVGAAPARPPSARSITQAIRRKIETAPGAPSQFTSVVPGVPARGTLVVHVQRHIPGNAPQVHTNVRSAVTRAQPQLALHPEVERLEFWVQNRSTPMIFVRQGGGSGPFVEVP
jgi:hypothetical protein